MCKYQTKYINFKLDELWEKQKEIKKPELAIDIMEIISDIRLAVNDKIPNEFSDEELRVVLLAFKRFEWDLERVQDDGGLDYQDKINLGIVKKLKEKFK